MQPGMSPQPAPAGSHPVQFATDFQQVLPAPNAAGIVGDGGVVRGASPGTGIPQPHLEGVNVFDRVDFVRRPLVSEGPEALTSPMKSVVHAVIRINPANSAVYPVEDRDGSPLRERLQRLQIEPHYQQYKSGARPRAIRTPLAYLSIESEDQTRLSMMGVYDVEALAGTPIEELKDHFDRGKADLFKERADAYLADVHADEDAAQLQAQIERLTKERDAALQQLKAQAVSHREFETDVTARLAALEDQGQAVLQESRQQAQAQAIARQTDPAAPTAGDEDPAPTPVS